MTREIPRLHLHNPDLAGCRWCYKDPVNRRLPANRPAAQRIRFYKPKREIHIIPLSYEPYLFLPKYKSELGLDANKVYLISIGRIVKRKGFDYLIRSLKLLNENIVLLIIGDGAGINKLIQLVYRLNLHNRVKFLGDVSEELKFQYLANSDLYILSSLHEGFGIVLQEAMQVGLPIVQACGNR